MKADARDRVNRLLGPSPLQVSFGQYPQSALVDSDDIVSVRTVRGRNSPDSPPDPWTITVELLAGVDKYVPEAGTEIGVTSSIDVALQAWTPRTPLPQPKSVAKNRGIGQVTDVGPLSLFQAGRAPRTMTVTATSVYARFARVTIGRAPWPSGTSDTLILQQAIATAWDTDPGIRVNKYSVPGDTTWRLYARTPSPLLFIQWDVDNQTVDQIVTDLIASTGGQFIEYGDGTYDWITAEARRGVGVWVDLDNAVAAPVDVAQSLGDLTNDVTVTYGPDDAQQSIRLDDPASVQGSSTRPRYGRYPTSRTTKLAGATDATSVAADTVGRYAYPEWRLTRVELIDLCDLVEQGRYELAYRIHTLDVGQLVNLPALPDYSPARAGLYWVEGIETYVTASSWVISLDLLAYELLAPPVRFADLPAALTFAQTPDWVTFNRATVWQPDPIPTGSFRELASNVTFDTVAGTIASQ